jgi:hypothetical protein
VDAIDRMVGDLLDDAAKIRFGIAAVQLGGLDQAVDSGGALTTGVGSGEGPVAAPDVNGG